MDQPPQQPQQATEPAFPNDKRKLAEERWAALEAHITTKVTAWLTSIEPYDNQPSGFPPMAVYKDTTEVQRVLVATTMGRFLVHDWLVFLLENRVKTAMMDWVCETMWALQKNVDPSDDDESAMSVEEIDQELMYGLTKVYDDLAEHGHGEWTFLSWAYWAGREDMLHVVLSGISDCLMEAPEGRKPKEHWNRLDDWRRIMRDLTDWEPAFVTVDWNHWWDTSAEKLWTQARGSLDNARRETGTTWIEKMEGCAEWIAKEDGVFEDGVWETFGLDAPTPDMEEPTPGEPTPERSTPRVSTSQDSTSLESTLLASTPAKSPPKVSTSAESAPKECPELDISGMTIFSGSD